MREEWSGGGEGGLIMSDVFKLCHWSWVIDCVFLHWVHVGHNIE